MRSPQIAADVLLKTHEPDFTRDPETRGKIFVIANFARRAADHREIRIDFGNTRQRFENQTQPFTLEVAERAKTEFEWAARG